MANIEITDQGASLADGLLQIANGVPLDSTLRNVADQNNTNSPLKLSTTLVQTTSTLQITTNDNPYIDAEDGAGNNRFTIGRATNSQQVNVDFASNPVGSTTIVGAIRTYQDGVNLSEVVKFREDGQVTFSERVNVEADSLVTTQTSSVIAADTTNASLVIAPNGAGALIAQIPDGTATGGNARGNNAVDLQMVRTNSNQVANGANSVIIGGIRNRASGLFAIAAGQDSVASGANSIAIGQNQASTASGTRSVAIGEFATASGQNFSVVWGGYGNLSSESYSTTVGGGENIANALYSFGSGYRSRGYLYGQFQRASGYFFVIGDAQESTLTARRQAELTTGATTILSLDGTGVTNLIIPTGNNRVWNVVASWTAVVTAITGIATGVNVGDVATECNLFAFKRIGGTSSVVGTVTNVAAHSDASMTTAAMGYTAGGSQELVPTFTAPTFAGGGSLTIRVVLKLMLTEVAY